MGRSQFKTEFQEAIAKYINSIDEIDEYNAKTDILMFVERAGKECNRDDILEVLEYFWHLPADLMDYFIPGSLFFDGNLVFGWYRPDQVKAEFLPVKLFKAYDRGFFSVMEVIGNRDGFQIAMSLPLSDGPIVSIPAGKHHLFARYGWAAPVHCNGIAPVTVILSIARSSIAGFAARGVCDRMRRSITQNISRMSCDKSLIIPTSQLEISD